MKSQKMREELKSLKTSSKDKDNLRQPSESSEDEDMEIPEEYEDQDDEISEGHDESFDIPQEGVSIASRQVPDFEPLHSKNKELALINVAILDDERFTLQMTEYLIHQLDELKLEGYIIKCRLYLIQDNQGVERFKKDIEKGIIHGVITDHDMIKGDENTKSWSGTDVIKFIKGLKDEGKKQLPILLNSAESNFDPNFLKKEKVLFIEKPINKHKLSDFIPIVTGYYEAQKKKGKLSTTAVDKQASKEIDEVNDFSTQEEVISSHNRSRKFR